MTETGPIIWDETGAPRSARHGDVYFSADGGLAESRAVFLAGCGLPGAWARRRRFTVGEIGFGTGLNIAALLALWRQEKPPGGRLSIFSIEADPLSAADARRALAQWPELAEITDTLAARWPGRARGLHRVDLPEFSATLDLYVGEAAEALAEWRGRADAWFLDGFSPALNPEAWRDEVLGLVGARSASGARAATFTVAGAVRRGLESAGFTVEKAPGFGRKRQRLEARFPGVAAEAATPDVAIIGAGIAGACVARALAALGLNATVHDAFGRGAGASGNPAALVNLRLDAGLGPEAALFARGLARARALYLDIPGAVLGAGALQLQAAERDLGRFRTIAGSDLFEPAALEVLNPEAAEALIGEPAPPALAIREALTIRPDIVLGAWAQEVRIDAVAEITGEADDFRLLNAAGAEIGKAGAVVLACAHGAVALAPSLDLQPIRGQITWAEGVTLSHAAGWGGYAIATPQGVLFGSTYDRDRTDAAPLAEDDARNLENLALGLPRLARQLTGAKLHGRAAIRAAAADRLPLAGAVPDQAGLFVLSGLGSRGFSLAPLLGEHVAALIAGAPSPLAASQAALVDPARFQERAARRMRLASKPR